MASETDHARHYLRGVLAEGLRPFRYRRRIRALLGLAESGGVEMTFAKPLPIGGFAYVRPRFSAEFDISDEMLAGAPPPDRFTPERAPAPHRQGAPAEPQGGGGRRAAIEQMPQGGRHAATTVQPVVIPGRTGPSRRDPPGGMPAPSSDEVGPDRVETAVPSPAAQAIPEKPVPYTAPERDRAVAAAVGEPMLRPAAAPEYGSAAQLHQPRHAGLHATTEQPPALPGAGSNAPASDGRDEPPLAPTAARSVVSSDAAAAPARRESTTTSPRPPVNEPSRVMPAAVWLERPIVAPRTAARGEAAPPDASPVLHAFDASVSSVAAPSPPRQLSHATVESPDFAATSRDDILPMRGVPRARRPDPPAAGPRPRPRARADSGSAPERDIASGPAADPAPAPPPIIVVNQPSRPDAVPLAFWERRHLTHLRTRLRR